MFDGIGVNWAGTLLGCVAVILIPIPIIFYIYGARIRRRSAFAPDMNNVMAAHGKPSSDEEKNVGENNSSNNSDVANLAADEDRSRTTGADNV